MFDSWQPRQRTPAGRWRPLLLVLKPLTALLIFRNDPGQQFLRLGRYVFTYAADVELPNKF